MQTLWVGSCSPWGKLAQNHHCVALYGGREKRSGDVSWSHWAQIILWVQKHHSGCPKCSPCIIAGLMIQHTHTYPFTIYILLVLDVRMRAVWKPHVHVHYSRCHNAITIAAQTSSHGKWKGLLTRCVMAADVCTASPSVAMLLPEASERPLHKMECGGWNELWTQEDQLLPGSPRTCHCAPQIHALQDTPTCELLHCKTWSNCIK